MSVGAPTSTLQLPLVSPLPLGEGESRWAAAPAELLEAAGYVEEEFLIAGFGNVYRYGRSGGLEVARASVPYVTQLLVRRPADPARFSGNVVFESQHGALPLGAIWGLCWDFFTANGDAWAQVLTSRMQLSGPQGLDPYRYASLHLLDEGQVWDLLAGAGAVLRNGAPGNPLGPDYDVRRVYFGGESGSTLVLLTYLGDGFHERHRLEDGSPVFDGYVPYIAHGSINYYRIASPPHAATSTLGLLEFAPHPSEQIALDDPRRTVQPHDVPVVHVITETEVILPADPPPAPDLAINMFLYGLPPTVAARMRYRRPDADEPGDRYRLYEIAGAAHIAPVDDVAKPMRVPPRAQRRPTRWLQRGVEKPVSDFPARLFLAAAWRNLYRWVDDDVAPPRAPRIEIDEASMTLVRDEHGNAAGGVRSPQLDVPAAAYAGVNPGSALLGAKEPFDRAKLVALYGDHDAYAAAFAARTDELVAEGWVLPQHRDALAAEAEKVRPLFDPEPEEAS